MSIRCEDRERMAMPLYFFDVNDGAEDTDHEGMTLPDIGAARRQAARIAVDYAASLVRERAPDREPGGAVVVTVRDRAGETGVTARLAVIVDDGSI